MTYQELTDLTNTINFDNVYDGEYTTGNGWTNARWSNRSSFIEFLNSCLDRNVAIRFSEKTGMNSYINHSFSIRDGKVIKTQ